MGDILSLSKARKTRAKAEKEQAAAENRIRFGRTKAEKAQDKALRLKAETKLDDHKRDT
jgi:hypothetical protein